MYKFYYNPLETKIEPFLPDPIIDKALKFKSYSITFFDEIRRRKTRYPIRKEINWCFYNYRDNSFPSGFLSRVIQNLDSEYSIECIVQPPETKVYDFETPFRKWLIENKKELRYFQTEATDLLIAYGNGVWEIGTGGGKTLAYANLIAKLGVKTLLITIDLQSRNDTYEDLKDGGGFLNFFGGENVGRIDFDNYRDYPIVVANIQNCWAKFRKQNSNFLKYLEDVSLVIFNECHHINESKIKNDLANTWYSLAMNIPAWYRLGGTGTLGEDNTLKRALLTGALGEAIYQKPSKDLMDEGFATPIDIHIYDMPFENNEHVMAIKAFETMIEDLEFKRNLCALALFYALQDLKIILFCEWREKQAKVLADLIGSKYCGLIHGQTKKEDRDKVLKEFADDRFPILVSTILSEDFNLPDLDVGIIVGKRGNPVALKQRLGRVARLSKGKEKGYIVMIRPMDVKINSNGEEHPGLLQKQTNKGIKILKDEGYLIEFKDFKDVFQFISEQGFII